MESFNGKLRDELLDGEIFCSLKEAKILEAKILIERWREPYNTVRPHSSPGYQSPAPKSILPRPSGPTYTAFRSTRMGDPNRQALTQQVD